MLVREFNDDVHKRRFVAFSYPHQDQIYHEIQYQNLEESIVLSSLSVVVLMLDTSGSMFDQHQTIQKVLQQAQMIASEMLSKECQVWIIFWANDSSCYQLTDEAHLRRVIVDGIDEDLISRRISDRLNTANEFQSRDWYKATYPRLGFQRLEQILQHYQDNNESLGYLNILFATDGKFSTSDPSKCLTPSYLQAVGEKLISAKASINVTYLGIYNDTVPDAKLIISILPNTKYYYAANIQALSDMSSTLMECIQGCTMNQQYSIHLSDDVKDPKHQIMVTCGPNEIYSCFAPILNVPNTVLLNSYTVEGKLNDSFQLRMSSHLLYTQLQQLLLRHDEGKDITEDFSSYDTKCGQLLDQLQKIQDPGSVKSQTQQCVYKVLRFKNELAKIVAERVHQEYKSQDRLMLSRTLNLTSSNQHFNIAVAKFITRNRKDKKDFTVQFHTVPHVENNSQTGLDYIVSLTMKHSNQCLTYITPNVPLSISSDDGIDFITMDTWRDIYLRGDGKCQCILLPQKPLRHLYTPSTIHVRTVNAQMSFNTILDTIAQQVSIQGDQSLFDQPLVGSDASQRYNAVLPTYTPNLGYLSRHRLHTLLGYIIGGHELAYPTRSADIYIPAILSSWAQYFENPGHCLLENSVLLTLAYKKIKTWHKLSNPAVNSAITSQQQLLQVYFQGETGSNAFPNPLEPLVYLLLCDQSKLINQVEGYSSTEEILQRVRQLMAAEVTYHAVHEYGPTFYEDIMKPCAYEIINLLELSEHPEELKELPVFQVNDRIRKIVQPIVDNISQHSVLISGVLAICTALTSQVWSYVEHHYRIPEKLSEQFGNILQSSTQKANDVFPVDELIQNMAIAHTHPSNSTRRHMNRRAGNKILLDVVLPVLVHQIDKCKQDRYYRERLNQFHQYHCGLPLSLNSDDVRWFSQQSRSTDPQQFIREFHQRFQDHIEFEAGLINMDVETYHSQLDTNLESVWKERAHLSLETSVTSLPKWACGFIRCPQFLRYNRALNHHLQHGGMDLPCKHPHNRWVPDFHIEMNQRLHLPQDRFSQLMDEYVQQYVDEQGLKYFQHLYNFYYKLKSAQHS